MATTSAQTVDRTAAANAARARSKGGEAIQLKSLEQQVEDTIAGVRQTVDDRAKHVGEMSKVGDKLAAALARQDISAAKILMSDFASATANRNALEKTQRAAMIRLAEAMKGATGELMQLTAHSPSELQRITDAEAAVKNAEGILEGLKAESTNAYTKTRFLGIRGRAIASTKAEVDAMESKIVTLKAAVQTQRVIADSERDARVNSVTLDQSATHILTATKEAVEMAKTNLIETRQSLSDTTINRTRTQKALTTYASDLTAAQNKLDRINATVGRLEHELEDMASVRGTQPYVDKSNELETKKQERVVLEGEQVKAMELFRTSEAALKEFTVQESSLQVHIQSIELEIAILEANVRDQTATISSFAIIAKRAEDLRSLHTADEVGRDMRVNVANATAEFTAAALRARAERAEAMPQHLKDLDTIIETSQQALADSDIRIAAQLDQLRANYEKTIAGAVPAS